MTTLEIIAMNRSCYKRTCRRQIVCARVLRLARNVFMVLALMLCFAFREELVRMIDNSLVPFVRANISTVIR